MLQKQTPFVGRRNRDIPRTRPIDVPRKPRKAPLFDFGPYHGDELASEAAAEKHAAHLCVQFHLATGSRIHSLAAKRCLARRKALLKEIDRRGSGGGRPRMAP